MTGLHHLNRRLDRLDEAASSRLIVVWQNDGETEEAAIGRWHAAHPGELESSPSNVQLIRWEAPR
jgi:hypothetical protein